MNLGKMFDCFSLPKVTINSYMPRSLTTNIRKQYQKLVSDHPSSTWTKKDLQKALGRQWRHWLEVLEVFIEEYKYITSRTDYTRLTISVYARNLLGIFKNHQTISNIINKAANIGLLVTKSTWEYDKANHIARSYIWNKRIQDLIHELVKEHKITSNKFKYEVNGEPLSANKRSVRVLLGSSYVVRFSSKLRIPTKVSGIILDEASVSEAIYKKYPWLQTYQKRMDEINMTLPAMEKIRFKTKMTTSKSGKYITKIGIRAHSFFCNLISKKDVNSSVPEFIDTAYRETYLSDIFYTKPYYYDVSSSIAKVTYLMNTGIWPSQDLYPLMAGTQFITGTQREGYKNLFMRLYFDSPGLLYHHNKTKLTIFTESEAKQIFKELKNNMEKTIGPSLDSEVFFHESCIYFDVYETLKLSGATVLQVYDSFWWTGSQYTPENIENLIAQKAITYFKYVQAGSQAGK